MTQRSQNFRKDHNQKRDLTKVFQIHLRLTKRLIGWRLRSTVGKIADKADIHQLRKI